MVSLPASSRQLLTRHGPVPHRFANFNPLNADRVLANHRLEAEEDTRRRTGRQTPSEFNDMIQSRDCAFKDKASSDYVVRHNVLLDRCPSEPYHTVNCSQMENGLSTSRRSKGRPSKNQRGMPVRPGHRKAT